MLTLVIGGTRSGKSAVAERLAAAQGDGAVTYVATGTDTDDDPGMAARIARHRARRPAAWKTIEAAGSLHEVLGSIGGLALVDSLGTWLASLPGGETAALDALVVALKERPGDTIVVTEEVGLSVHAPTEVGRRFADQLGEVNRRVAEVADRCLLVVAGRVVELPTAPALEPASSAGSSMVRRPSRPSVAGLTEAVGFLTALGRAATPGHDAPLHFPIVGAALGLALGLVWAGLDGSVPPLVLAGLLVTADLGLTGMLHVDGLADSADGLLPHLTRSRRLAVMSDPRTGAFGVTVVAGTLWLRAAALASFAEPQPLLLASLWCASRTSMAVALGSLPYARSAGLATTMAGASPVPVGILGVVMAVGLAAWGGAGALAGVGAAVIGAAAVHALALRRLGGFTGDTVGAAGVVGETIGLVLAVIVAS